VILANLVIMNEPMTEPTVLSELLEKNVQKLALDKIQRHLFLCCDQTKPKCCDKAVSLEAWDYLKRRLQELELDKPSETSSNCIFRTKANCLRVCAEGPILLVYPDGVWYRQAAPEVIERILQEHIIGNQIVEDYAFLSHPLPNLPDK
jgi:(2Fe-2S) ferredoxin